MVKFLGGVVATFGFDGSVILLGDFNEVVCPEERRNCYSFSLSMEQFNDFIHFSGLIDLPLYGRKYTWRNSVSSSKIDRCLVNFATNANWHFMNLTTLPRRLSNHIPLLFSAKLEVDQGPKPFHSLDCWQEHEFFFLSCRKLGGLLGSIPL